MYRNTKRISVAKIALSNGEICLVIFEMMCEQMMKDFTSKVVLKKIAKNKRAFTTMSYGHRDDVQYRKVSDASTPIAHVL
jgi:hypothetical protein